MSMFLSFPWGHSVCTWIVLSWVLPHKWGLIKTIRASAAVSVWELFPVPVAIITSYLDIVALADPHSVWQWGLWIVWLMLMWSLWFTAVCRLLNTCVIVGLNNGWFGLFSAKISLTLLQVSYGSSLHITLMFVVCHTHEALCWQTAEFAFAITWLASGASFILHRQYFIH